MTAVTISTIVEGHGEVEAVPVLIRRIASRIDPAIILHLPRPMRLSRLRLVRTGELERAIDFAGRTAAPTGAILVLIDAETDCPAELAPALIERARRVRHDLPLSVVLAHREYESWFLAGAESLAGRRDLPASIPPPVDPEAVRGAKEWLSARMPKGRSYRETRDQAALTAALDLDLAARRSPSLRKLERDLARLVMESTGRTS